MQEHTMHPDAFPLLAAVHARTDGATTTDADLRRAVTALVAAAAPARADRLAPRPGEHPALVARLAVWALRRVGPDAIAEATAALAGQQSAEGLDAADPFIGAA